MLTKPLEPLLRDSSSVLLSGAGGGYDVVGAVPLLVELRRAGKEVHLGSLSSMALETFEGAEAVPDVPSLFRLSPAAAVTSAYCAEAWLAAWLADNELARPQVWCFQKTGVQPLRKAYQHLVERLGIDTVVLVDGGIDSILRGDETSLGTPGSDLVSIGAVNGLPGVGKALACVGFGTELRDGIAHAQALRAIARLLASGGFLGCVSLTPNTEAGEGYLSALDCIFSNQAEVRRSHVHSVVRSALQGEFGFQGRHTWISPLSSLYWFFSLREVARNHLFLEALESTTSIWQANSIIEGLRKNLEISDSEDIPL